MTGGMKQRMIGAAVLVAIGIIAWTVVFDPSQVDRFSQRTQIPPRPDFAPVEIVPAKRPEQLRTLDYDERNRKQLQAQIAEAETPAVNSSLAEDETTSRTDEFGLPVLWAVQLGSFGQRDNALELKERVEKDGYHVIVQTVTDGGESLTRVLLEPKADRQTAEQLRERVDRKFGTGAMVVRYYPG